MAQQLHFAEGSGGWDGGGRSGPVTPERLVELARESGPLEVELPTPIIKCTGCGVPIPEGLKFLCERCEEEVSAEVAAELGPVKEEVDEYVDGLERKAPRPAGSDLEASTFQKRPCYRYIRAADKLPAVGSGAKVAKVKLFNPGGPGTWYLAEYDPETRIGYGKVTGLAADEYGEIYLPELVAFRGAFGLPLERDLYWTPRPLEEC